MNAVKGLLRGFLNVVLSIAAIALIGHAGAALADEITVALGGNQEIPPVTTSGTGTGTLTVGPDKSIGGKVTISGMNVTVAHIHEAAAGANGPIVIPLTKVSDNVWAVPAGAKLTDAQYEAYRASRLYFNIHSEAYKSGEIRGQIKP
jgi:CHRD domain